MYTLISGVPQSFVRETGTGPRALALELNCTLAQEWANRHEGHTETLTAYTVARGLHSPPEPGEPPAMHGDARRFHVTPFTAAAEREAHLIVALVDGVRKRASKYGRGTRTEQWAEALAGCGYTALAIDEVWYRPALPDTPGEYAHQPTAFLERVLAHCLEADDDSHAAQLQIRTLRDLITQRQAAEAGRAAALAAGQPLLPPLNNLQKSTLAKLAARGPCHAYPAWDLHSEHLSRHYVPADVVRVLVQRGLAAPVDDAPDLQAALKTATGREVETAFYAATDAGRALATTQHTPCAPPARRFDPEMIKISGPRTDQGAFDRAVMVARAMWENGTWDGISELVIHDPDRAYRELDRGDAGTPRNPAHSPR